MTKAQEYAKKMYEIEFWAQQHCPPAVFPSEMLAFVNKSGDLNVRGYIISHDDAARFCVWLRENFVD